MKRNKILYGAIFLIGAFTITSCSQSFLEPKPIGQSLESNYYSTPNEAYAGLVAAYAPMQSTYNGPYCASEGLANAASDECYGGGSSSSDQKTWTAMNIMSTLTPALMPDALWTVAFRGVAASNLILSKLDGAGLDDATKSRYTAEAKFLRAYYYFRLVRWFGNVPLFTDVVPASDLATATQSAPSDVYAQIEQDLNDAINANPGLPTTVSGAELGRASQGSAKALLGKVYLFDKKYTEAANVLKDVNGTPGSTSQYGYHLLSNYGAIFTTKFNTESILEIQHSQNQNYGDWSGNSPTGNMYSIMCGPRGYARKTSAAPDIPVSGWGFTPITPDLYDAMVISGKYDPRYRYTIYNMDSLKNVGACTYAAIVPAPDFPYSGYYIVKYAPTAQFLGGGGTYLNYGVDYIEIRLADTYLMEAEALVQGGGDQSRAQALLDAVRKRVGLPSVPVTMDAIKNERHLELATEGHRFFDLVRWGDADKVLNHMEKGFSKGFVVGKNEILPIPLAELTNTKMVQNPGY